MSDLGGLLYDKDAVYIDIPNWKVQYSAAAAAQEGGQEDGQGDQGGEEEDVAALAPNSQGEAMVRAGRPRRCSPAPRNRPTPARVVLEA